MDKSKPRVEEKKAALVRDFKRIRTAIFEGANNLEPKWHNTLFLGSWSVIDLFAHLQGWDVANSEAIDRIFNGEIPEFYAYYDTDWRRYNSILVERYRRDDFASLMVGVVKSHHLLIEKIRSLSY